MSRYFARISRGTLQRPDGPAEIGVYTAGGMQIGIGFFSGYDAVGDSIWSLQIAGRWIGGRWKIEEGMFTPAR